MAQLAVGSRGLCGLTLRAVSISVLYPHHCLFQIQAGSEKLVALPKRLLTKHPASGWQSVAGRDDRVEIPREGEEPGLQWSH